MLSLSVASPSNFPISRKPPFPFPKSSFSGLQISHVCQVASPSLSLSKTVVMMAKREEELKEIRAKTTEEINEEIVDLKGELFMLRLQKSARNEFKSSEFRRMRKRVPFLKLTLMWIEMLDSVSYITTYG